MTQGIKQPLYSRLMEKVKVNPETNCWEWQGGKNNVGYGMIRDGDKMRTTHRVAYEEHYGVKIPKGMCVLHTCDNPSCVNPEHLWLGTHKDNMKDMADKNRSNSWFIQKAKCNHCGFETHKALLKRWHNDNCKHKP